MTTTAPPAAPTTAPARLPVKLVLTLGALVTLGPATIDMYLPALPTIATDLRASASAVQLTLAATLAGIALGQLVAGPASDRFGRKRPMLAGLALHITASLLVTVAPTVATLGVLRLLQGLGAAAVAVTANAIVRDLYSGAAMATLLSRLILVIGVAPVLAPTVGGVLLTTTSWRGIFVVLAAIAAALAVLATRGLEETLPPERRSSGGLRGTLTSYRRILRDRTFVGLVLVAGLAFGSLFAYVSGSPFVLQDEFGLSQQQFAFSFGAGALFLIVSTQINVRLLRTRAPEQILMGGLALGVVSALVLVLTAATGLGGLAGLLVPLWLGLAAVGFCLPNTAAMALSRHGEAAGTAAALLGAGQFGVGALAAPLVGFLGEDSLAMAVTILGCVLLASGLLALSRREARTVTPAG